MSAFITNFKKVDYAFKQNPVYSKQNASGFFLFSMVSPTFGQSGGGLEPLLKKKLRDDEKYLH